MKNSFRGIEAAVMPIFIFWVILLAGCSVKQVYLDRAIIRNETGGIISGIKVLHEPTGKFGEVHSILPHNQFELGFAAGPMLAERSTVKWQGHDGRKRSAELKLPTAADVKTQDKAKVLFYTIYPNGIVTVELR